MSLLMLKCVLALVCISTLASAGFFDKRNVLITDFKYRSCDSGDSPRNMAWVKDADVMTTAYGDLDVLGTFVTAVNLSAPIKASVSLRKKVLGIYVPLPCIKKFGSCDYSDLCIYGYSAGEECPAIFDEHDIPCRCPIKAGLYSFPGGQFQVPKTRWAGILAGHYKASDIVTRHYAESYRRKKYRRNVTPFGSGEDMFRKKCSFHRKRLRMLKNARRPETFY